MAEYKRYPEYKDSGVEWLGEVPAEWEVTPIKKIAQLKNGRDTSDGEKHAGNYPVYSSAGLFGLTNDYLAEGPSVMFGRKGTIDKPFLIESGKFWHVDTVFRSEINCRLVSPKMFFYIAKTIDYKYLVDGAAVPSMTQTKIHNWKIVLPSLETQHQIVNFLDAETAHIDAGIANMKSLITLLTEKRAALISEVITRGIPGEHSEFKDSGVAWLGEIPAEWGVKKLTSFATLKGGGTPNTNDISLWDGEITWVTPKDFTSSSTEYLVTSERTISEAGLKTISGLIPEGAVLMTCRAPVGNVAIAGKELAMNQGYIAAIPSEIMDNRFLYFALVASKEEMQSHSKGGTFQEISRSRMGLVRFPVPPRKDQKKMVKFLDKETTQIDLAIENAKSLIELMKEKRQVLISDVVTGKINVTNSAN